jgi:hypothetical protein
MRPEIPGLGKVSQRLKYEAASFLIQVPAVERPELFSSDTSVSSCFPRVEKAEGLY